MELHELLALVVETFTRLAIAYLVTGSVASMATSPTVASSRLGGNVRGEVWTPHCQ